jgi:hypothetical protein
MNSASRFLVGGFMAAVAACVTPAVRAELDYEFAKKLMDRDGASFDTDDLVEHLVAQLEANAATKIEGKLIKATLRRKQAGSASVEKRKALLDEAEVLYKEVLAGPKTFKHYAVAEKDASTITSARATTMIKAADELKKSNPSEARKMRDEAIATIGKIADGYKAVVDEKYPKFKAVYDKYVAWRDKENPNGDKPIPKEIMAPLGTTFDDWLLADKRYVATKVEQLECYDDGDGAKKKVGEELVKLVKTRAEDQIFWDFPVIVAWYNYMLGRTFAAVQDEAKAAEAWNEALLVDMNEMGPDQKKAMFTLKKLILHNLVKMKMRAKKYADVEGIIVEALTEPSLRTLFDEDSGKELLIDYAKALTLPSDATGAEYEKAIKKLREYIAKETKGGAQTRWANEFSRTIAELLEEAKQNKPNARPKLTASEWYDAARGFFLMGQNEYQKFTDLEKDKDPKANDQFEVAYGEYQNAVDYYRRAVAEARNPKTELPTRINIEPKAWFEMGLCYLKMKHYYEAIVVYQAMRESYLPEKRKSWLPEMSKGPMQKYAKIVGDLLTELDKPKDGLVYKSGQNVLFALDKNTTVHNNPKDSWNPRLKPMIQGDDSGIRGENEIADVDYQAAKNDMVLAKQLSDAAREAAKSDEKLALDTYAQSAAKYLASGDRFGKVKSESKGYELALYQSGSAFTMAQALYVTGKVAGAPKELQDKSKELGLKAIQAFDKYDDFTTKNKAEKEEDQSRRDKLAGAILLARNALHSGAGEWEKVVATSEQYLNWETQQKDLQKSSADVALLNKFRAQIELASVNLSPACDPYLAAAEKTMRGWRKMKAGDNKTFVFMLNALSRRNNIAAFQVDKFIKEGKKEFNAEMIDKYENAVANYQSERVSMIEKADNEDPTLDDYTRLVYLFNKTRRDRQCADTAKKLLEIFDKENKSSKIPDDPKVWQEKLQKVQSIIKYNDLAKWDRCKKDHAVLVDYMYDTREGITASKPEQRPEFDKFNVDMDKARNQIDTIKKNYPDCQSLDSKLGEGGKSLLGIIEDEVDFRRKILATRELLFDKAMKVAASLEKDNPDEAKHYKEAAFGQIDILTALKGETPDLLTMKSNIAISIGNFTEALATLNQVRFEAPEGSAVYFNAAKKISEVHAMQKKWVEAAEYPEFLALTIGFDAPIVKDRWPDMKDFLRDCYINGAPAPKALEKLKEPKKEEQPAEEVKKDEAAAPAPAPAAPAAPVPAPATDK